MHDFRRPVYRRIVFLGDQKLAGRAIHRVGEAVAIEVHKHVMGRAVDLHAIDQDHSLTPS